MPDYAPDAITQAEALARFEAEGFTGQFRALEGGRAQCLSCRQESPAKQIGLQGLIRNEGQSDPSEMSAIAALVCPHCGAKGTLLLGYGPEAPTEDGELLSQLTDDRVETGTSPGS